MRKRIRRYRECHGKWWGYTLSPRLSSVCTTNRRLRVRRGQRVVIGFTYWRVTATASRHHPAVPSIGRRAYTLYTGAIRRERDMTDEEMEVQFERR